FLGEKLTILLPQQHNKPSTMSGGNWKDLLKATRQGDLPVMKIHLQNNKVDPNYQHPEYFTSPVFEAIRHGRLDAVKLLLEHGGSPTMIEDSTDQTPLEVAMAEQKHDIVDLLLTKLSNSATEKDAVRPYLKRVAIQLDEVAHLPTIKLISAKILEQGHRVVILLSECFGGDDDSPVNDDDIQNVVKELRQQTGNLKVEAIVRERKNDISSELLVDVDTLICFVTNTTSTTSDGEDGLDKRLENATKGISSLNREPRLVLLFDSQSSDAVSSSLLLVDTKTEAAASRGAAAIQLYDSWLNRMTSRWWQEDWVKSVAWMATEHDSVEICGKIHLYDSYSRKMQSAALF
ncbi:MAG: hypothetical protein SGILL_007239, partial [Bacillariaceae sp.]